MKRVCAWCGRELPAKAGEEGLISHGICAACADDMFSGTAITLQRHLDKLLEPVIVVDGDVTVSFLNRRAQALLGLSPEQALHRKGGEVFDCAYSHLSGGCGRTIHCSGCVIRRAVSLTHETGEPQVRVPATLKKGDPDHPDSVALTITTVKQGDAVLLRLDRV